MKDEIFARFLQKNGKITSRQEVPPSSVERYKGKLPDLLLGYWLEHGWFGCGEGLFWVVNPQEYEGVVAAWLSGTALEGRDTYHLVARSAFGDLYLYGERTGFSLSIDAPVSRYSLIDDAVVFEDRDLNTQNFLLLMDEEYNDFDGLFKSAKKKLGAPSADEMYGFVPALGLGGRTEVESIEKVKCVEHLVFLSQLADFRPFSQEDI